MPRTCTHCGNELGAAALEVHVAKEFEREAQSGTFCVDKPCFVNDTERHRRLQFDAEVFLGSEWTG